MFSSLRSRLWLTYALIIVVILCVVGAALTLHLYRNPPAVLRVRERLRFAAATAERQRIFSDSLDRLEDVARRVDDNFDLRVLLIEKNSGLVFDSRSMSEPLFPLPSNIPPRVAPDQIRNVRDAEGQSWLYVVAPAGPELFVIFAVERPALTFMSLLRDELIKPLLRAGLIAFILSLLLALWMSRSVAAPLSRMAEVARRVATGERKVIKLEGPREVRSLAKAFNEMTGQLQASQQSQKDFIANVSHELKTPLTAVEGFAQAILDGTADSPEAIQRSAQVIRSEAGRMHRMVMDLLDLARLDAGTADFQRAPVDLGKLLSDITARFIPLSHDADVNLQTHIRTLPGFIGDGDRLAQVFANLIDNAIKHTPAGGEVTLYAEPAGDKVKIWVSDTGQGIPPEELSRVFERFYQLDKSRRGGKGRGVGLGLAIAREIVHAHGGGLTVESHVGQGSKFIVQLPVARPDDETLNTSRKVE